MVHTLDQAVKHNHKFWSALVDLKVTGWKSYTSALNNYTFGFFKKQLEESDKSISELGDLMKKVPSTK